MNSIAQLAGALAKAQAELTNPEKSLIATIRSRMVSGEPSGRSAMPRCQAGSRSSARRLGKHEIATVQTTSIEQAAGIVNLTTRSGACVRGMGRLGLAGVPVSETAAPHRMGAALTYARRYALFTLVGIAGEDDLDAPDLAGQVQART